LFLADYVALVLLTSLSVFVVLKAPLSLDGGEGETESRRLGERIFQRRCSFVCREIFRARRKRKGRIVVRRGFILLRMT
jgi:hypothetical protein